MVPFNYYLLLSALLFTIGVFGFVTRKNAIVMFMCVELMLNSINISFATFSKIWGNLNGQVGVFFVMIVAAAEAAVGLAIVISIFRAIKSVETTDTNELNN